MTFMLNSSKLFIDIVKNGVKSVMVPTIKLNNNLNIPILGMGSSQAKPGEMEEAIKLAIDLGYRNFDSAMFYKNEHEVGAAVRAKIQEGKIKREDVFITNKLWNTFHRQDMVVPACKNSLQAMGLDYLDLYLIHFPSAFKDGMDLWPADDKGKIIPSDTDYIEAWKGMEECVRQGLVKSIGLSNFNSEQIQRVLDIATIKPTINQVECYPYLNQNKLRKFCKDRGIILMAYAPLGRPGNTTFYMKSGIPPVLEDAKLLEIAAKYNKTVAQIILRYLVQYEIVPIPKSSNVRRLKENLDIFDFQLSPEDVSSIDALNQNNRAFTYPDMTNFKDYPFHIEY